MDTVSGDTFLAECARYIRYNEAKLGNVPGPSSAPAGDGAAWYNPTTWLSPLGNAPAPPSSSQQGRGRSATQPLSSKGKAPAAPSPHRRNRPTPLRVSAHHLFYVLLRCEGLGLPIGHLDVRIPAASRPASYFAFISSHAAGAGTRRKEKDDTMSVSSFQTTMSTLSSLGAGGSGSWWSAQKNDPISNIKYIYSAMTKIPALRIIPPPLKLICDFEDCPGEMSVPLEAFKNVQYLEFEDADPRSFLGWDRLSYQLRSLSMKRSGVEDVGDVLIDAVLNDGKRRRGEPVKARKRKVHAPQRSEVDDTDGNVHGADAEEPNGPGSGSDEKKPDLPSLSWHFLRHLGLSDNSLTFLHSRPISCVTSLTSLDLSHNLLNAVPPCLQLLPNLTSLNVSNNLIDSVLGIPAALPAIEALNLSHNRLESLCGLERLATLVRIDLRHNEVYEAGEIGRLATLPSVHEVHAALNPLYDDENDARVLVLTEFAREGHDLDRLKLDDEVAGYFEKQRIRERVPNMDRLQQQRRGRRSEPNDANTMTITSSSEGTPRQQTDRQEIDNATVADTAGNKLKVKNVRHRGGARHGARAADGRAETAKQAEQRRNRRVVDLNDSLHESQDVGQGAGSSTATDNAAPAPVPETTESDAIKDAARQGKLDEAMGAIALVSQQQDDATQKSNDEVAARREPGARAKVGRRGKARAIGSATNGSSSGGLSSTDEATVKSADQVLAKGATTANNNNNAGEDLRRRIEALKGEVGDDWMRLLARGESVYVPSTSASAQHDGE